MKTVDDVPAWLEKTVKQYKGAWPACAKYIRVQDSMGQLKLEQPEFDEAARLISGEPDDSEAPEWARWKCQDSKGRWFWYSEQPVDLLAVWALNETSCTAGGRGTVLGDWRNTLKPVNREGKAMIRDKTADVERKKVPKGATHEYGGIYYQLLPNGVWLGYDIFGDDWTSDTSANLDSSFAGKLRPIDDPKVAPEEDEAWERKMADQEAQHSDPVNHPEHYTQGGIECIDAIQASMSPDEFAGYLKGNMVKYIWRYKHKGGAQDLKKARWYLERLEAHVDSL